MTGKHQDLRIFYRITCILDNIFSYNVHYSLLHLRFVITLSVSTDTLLSTMKLQSFREVEYMIYFSLQILLSILHTMLKVCIVKGQILIYFFNVAGNQ